MKYAAPRPYADPEAAARKLIELANAVEPVQDGRIHIELINGPKYPHCYPDSHPQSKSNPQESWCYPLAALGAYREWLQDVYIEGGKFSIYLKGKVSKGEIAPSVAQLAIAALAPTLIGPPL